ncbi:MAG: aspartyl/asparaginyl beta-hydroxylase domain-containing protein [Chromatiales bacterium]|nr:aspartyl/asparaginyl beta-hydroxylase domain-containing protein [Chromatiales bacterium]
MFRDPHSHPAVARLEAAFGTIRDEFRALHDREFVPWPERYLYGEGWTVFGLYFEHRPIEHGCGFCPQTAAVLAEIGPIRAAGFSRLAPNTHIQPHCGRPKQELRCHLGIVIPDGDLGLRVGPEVRNWREGECLLFDDTVEHEAWNRTSSDRIVLLVDIPRAD